MNNNYIYFLVAVSLFFLFSSCEDVVSINLQDADALLVVDGWINNKAEAQTIRLTNTAPYFEAEFTPGVSGATVNVESSTGETFSFVDQGNGDYNWDPSSNQGIGQIGDEFTLNIELNGKIYSSSTQLNRVPPVDSITQITEDETTFSEESIECNFFSRDPIGSGDTYWIKTFKNGEFLNKPLEITYAYDAGFSAGSEIDGLIFIPPIRDQMNPVSDGVESGEKSPSPWVVGDVAKVEIHSISLEAYYFIDIVQTQLLNSLNGIFAEPLFNTKGNVEHTNGEDEVLGMFVVSAISELEYTIQ